MLLGHKLAEREALICSFACMLQGPAFGTMWTVNVTPSLTETAMTAGACAVATQLLLALLPEPRCCH